MEAVAIGVVRSPLVDAAQAPRQGDEGAPEARIEVTARFRPALDGIVPGERVLVLTWLDRGDRDVLVTHPRGDTSRAPVGVFATRSPDRPNPIGLHLIQVNAIEGGVLSVGGLEALDGTPVLDIKPVLSGDVDER